MTSERRELLEAVNLLEHGASNQIDYPTQAMRGYHVKIQKACELLRKNIESTPTPADAKGGADDGDAD